MYFLLYYCIVLFVWWNRSFLISWTNLHTTLKRRILSYKIGILFRTLSRWTIGPSRRKTGWPSRRSSCPSTCSQCYIRRERLYPYFNQESVDLVGHVMPNFLDEYPHEYFGPFPKNWASSCWIGTIIGWTTPSCPSRSCYPKEKIIVEFLFCQWERTFVKIWLFQFLFDYKYKFFSRWH